MEELERFIGFQKIRSCQEGVMEPTTVLLQVCSPVRSRWYSLVFRSRRMPFRFRYPSGSSSDFS